MSQGTCAGESPRHGHDCAQCHRDKEEAAPRSTEAEDALRHRGGAGGDGVGWEAGPHDRGRATEDAGQTRSLWLGTVHPARSHPRPKGRRRCTRRLALSPPREFPASRHRCGEARTLLHREGPQTTPATSPGATVPSQKEREGHERRRGPRSPRHRLTASAGPASGRVADASLAPLTSRHLRAWLGQTFPRDPEEGSASGLCGHPTRGWLRAARCLCKLECAPRCRERPRRGVSARAR